MTESQRFTLTFINADLFDPVTRTSTAAGDMTTARSGRR